jgi:hypothetical protein
MEEFFRQVGKGRITSANFQCFLDKPPELPTFRVTVNYDLPFDQMVAAGKYQWFSEGLKASRKADVPADYFKLTGTGQQEVDIVLLHLISYDIIEEVLAEMMRLDLRPATIEELLVLGAVQPHLQRDYPIVAFGSHCLLDGGDYVPVLNNDGGRGLILHYYNYEWDDDYRFAAVRI